MNAYLKCQASGIWLLYCFWEVYEKASITTWKNTTESPSMLVDKISPGVLFVSQVRPIFTNIKCAHLFTRSARSQWPSRLSSCPSMCTCFRVIRGIVDPGRICRIRRSGRPQPAWANRTEAPTGLLGRARRHRGENQSRRSPGCRGHEGGTQWRENPATRLPSHAPLDGRPEEEDRLMDERRTTDDLWFRRCRRTGSTGSPGQTWNPALRLRVSTPVVESSRCCAGVS